MDHPIVDVLEKEEAEQLVNAVFDIKQARQCRDGVDRKEARMALKTGKHERMTKLIKDHLRAKATQKRVGFPHQ